MSKMKKTRADAAFDVANAALLLLLLVILFYPLYFVLVASISDPYAIAQGQVTLLPVKPTLEAYQNIMKDSRIWVGYRNTILYTVFGTMLSLALTIPAAYVLSKKDLPGRGFLMTYCLITMYFGGGLIPTYLIVKDLGLLNKAYTLVVLGSVSVYNLIVTRSFFQSTLPDALFESARIDGASEGRMFFSIALPLSGSILAVMALYYGVARWNEFFNALIYVSNVEYQPLQLVLRSLLLQSQQAVLDAALTNDSEMLADAARLALMAEAMKYAIIFIASAPLLVAYPFVQKHFVKGVMIGALKG